MPILSPPGTGWTRAASDVHGRRRARPAGPRGHQSLLGGVLVAARVAGEALVGGRHPNPGTVAALEHQIAVRGSLLPTSVGGACRCHRSCGCSSRRRRDRLFLAPRCAIRRTIAMKTKDRARCRYVAWHLRLSGLVLRFARLRSPRAGPRSPVRW